MTSSRIYKIFAILAIFKFWVLQFVYIYCVELLWKNQGSIINNSKVIMIYILIFFRFQLILSI